MDTFILMTCQPGSERLLKADMQLRCPDAKPSFSRPGLITFKRPAPALPLTFERPTPFARTWALSVGTIKHAPEHPEEAVAPLLALIAQHQAEVIHIWRRDTAQIDDERAPDAWDQDDQEAQRWRALLPALTINVAPKLGQRVLSVIISDPGQLWCGLHEHTPQHRDTVGGRPPKASAPQEAPSRVWHKIEEALWWSKLPYQAGELVLDIGCSPGGGTFNLLERGLVVVGVDPAEVAPSVLNHPSFTHEAVAFERFNPDASMSAQIKWLIFDVNLAPTLTLKQLAKLGRQLEQLQGALITLKLNQPDLIQRLDWMFAQIERMGLKVQDVTQLFYNRQEVCVYATRR